MSKKKQSRERAEEMFLALANPKLTPDEVRNLAWETGFQKRPHRKIEPLAFAALLLSNSVNGDPSYNDLAGQTEALEGSSVSRQGVWKRVNAGCVRFFQAILARAIMGKLPGSLTHATESCTQYRRVLVQDSTVVRLPVRLFDAFSGVANADSRVCNARIQVVYDLAATEFVAFSVDPYSKNDHKAACELELQEGDLALRDRGYLSGDEIQRHLDMGADCIYRHKSTTVYLNPETGDPIDLLAILERDGNIDTDVLLNNSQKTPVRLVAAPVNEETANLRRMKLKKEARGHKPSAKLLRLMSWTIFITTIPRCTTSFRDLLAIYGLRWRIETIFKAWKSNMNFATIHDVSEKQLKVLFAARMAMIVMWSHIVFRPALERIRTQYGGELSMLKTTRYLMLNPQKVSTIMVALLETTGRSPELNALARYCTYDKRKRLNFNQIQDRVFKDWGLS